MKFSPRIKKILQQNRFRNCAYVYTDGVVIRQETEATANGQTFKTELIHIIPYTEEIKFTSNRTGDAFKGRYVFHNPTLLIDGVRRLNIYHDNAGRVIWHGIKPEVTQ